jgi:hypothetical protein
MAKTSPSLSPPNDLVDVPPDDLLDVTEKPKLSTLQAARIGFEESILPTLTGLATGALTGAGAGSFVPVAGNIVGGIAGGIAGGYAASKAQERLLQAAPETARALGLGQEEREAAQEEHPYVTAIAGAVPNLLAMHPTTEVLNLFKAGATQAEKAAAKQALATGVGGGALSGAIDLTQQTLSGQPIDPYAAMIAAGIGFTGMKETRLGRAITSPTTKLGENIGVGLGGKRAEPIPEVKTEVPTETKPSAEAPAQAPEIPESPFQDTTAAFKELTGEQPVEKPTAENPPVEVPVEETPKEQPTVKPAEEVPSEKEPPASEAPVTPAQVAPNAEPPEVPAQTPAVELPEVPAQPAAEVTKSSPLILNEQGERVDTNGAAYHPLESHNELDFKTREQEIQKGIDEAKANGIDLHFTQDENTGQRRIDPNQSTLDWEKIKGTKNVGEILNQIKDYVPLEYQQINERILPFVQDVKAKINNRWTRGLRGQYSPDLHEIQLGKNTFGNNFETITHEAIHAATSRNYWAGHGTIPKFEYDPRFTEAANQLDELHQLIKKSKQNTQLRMLGNSISTPRELLTWGLTDREAQNLFKQVKVPDTKQTVWSKFVSTVRGLLGIPKSEENALTRIIDLSERLSKHAPPKIEAYETAPGVRRKDIGYNNQRGFYEKYELPVDQSYFGNQAQNDEHILSQPLNKVTQAVSSVIKNPHVSPKWLGDFMYNWVNRHIDLKNMHDSLVKAGKNLPDKFNAWLQHSLSINRRNNLTKEFARDEALPLAKKMKEYGISVDELDKFLHNAHAEERNIQNNKTNEYLDGNGNIALVNPSIENRGSGIHTDDARKYLNSLTPDQRAKFDDLAKEVRKIVDKTQDMLVASGQEKQDTIDQWRNTYKNYVPLNRLEEELNFTHGSHGTGSGYASSGASSRRAVGSLKTVGDILENIGLQRVRAINRAEDIKVGQALYGQLLKHPIPDFATVINPDVVKNPKRAEQELINLGLNPQLATRLLAPPKKGTIDPRTGLANYGTDPAIRSADNVLPVRINGEDRYIVFNTGNEQAMRMVGALKNADSAVIPPFMRLLGKGTHWLSAVNTQYNPVFGAWNFMRDTQAGIVNLVSTPLKNSMSKVAGGTFPALKAIWAEERALRNGGQATGPWADAYRLMKKSGGKLEFGQRIMDDEGKANLFAEQLKNLNAGNVRQVANKMFHVLSDYNEAMENAVRLSTFKNALDLRTKEYPNGMSPSKAAELASNITVNFNQKGQKTPYAASLFSFFNASVQSTERLAQTLNSPLGRKIVAGGLAIGAGQALALAAAGFDDEDIPDYVKEKNFIIPLSNGKYVIAPMPPGLNIIPNFSRNITDYVLSRAGMIHSNDSAAQKAIKSVGSVLSSFDPLGTGPIAQKVTPTLLRPIVAASMNEDAFGRPISRQDQPGRPVPGYQRTRDNASTLSKYMAEFLNRASGGTEYQKGSISPTGDDLDFMTGQYLGGVSREAMKAAETAKSLTTGEPQPTYRIPVVGKLIGDKESPQDIANKFYQNADRMAGYKAEIEGRQKNRGTGSVSEVIANNPEASLYKTADNIHSQLVKLNQQKKLLQQKGADVSRLQNIEGQKTRIMKRFNDAVRARQ